MDTEVKNYTTGQVEEEIYASVVTVAANTTTPLKAEEGRIRNGYNAVIVGLASNNTLTGCRAYIKINGKQYYTNGIYLPALPANMEEVGLFIPLIENDAWELGFTNITSSNVDIVYRLRIRLFKR